MASQQSPQIRVRRPNIPRTTTGCLCCRLRRKKCEENQPVCNGCDRNRLMCTWPQQSRPDQKSKSSDFGWKGAGSGGMLDSSKLELLSSEALATRSDMVTEDSLPIQSAFKQIGLSAIAYNHLPLSAAPGNPILKRPHAGTLLQHYITVTARHLPVAMWMEDTFIAHILPVAHSDDLVLQGVLALSGAHLSSKSTDGNIKQATWTHYALDLRGVKHALTRTMSGGNVDMLHLLLTTLLLCQVEVSLIKA